MKVLAGHASTLVLCACSIALLLPPRPALGDFTGLQTVRRTDVPICQDPSQPDIPYKLDVCSVYAAFNDPTDLFISVGSTSASTDDPNGFFQHSMGLNTSPLCWLVTLFPALVCDSYGTVGNDCDDFTDTSTLDPDFDRTLFNTAGGVAGGWYNSAPSNGQGVPDANGLVLIAQFSVKQNRDVTGALSVFATIGGADDATEFPLQAFDCSTATPGSGGGTSGSSGGSGPVPQGQGAGTAGSPVCGEGGTCLCPDVELGGANEPALAVNPLNPLNIAVAWNPHTVAPNNSLQQLTISTDGGQTWCGDPCSPCDEPLEGIIPAGFCLLPFCELGGDPSLAFDSTGRLFWCYVGVTAVPPQGQGGFASDIIILEVDPTTGMAVGNPALVINDTTVDADKPWIAVDSTDDSPHANRLYVIWTHFPAAGPHFIAVSYADGLEGPWSAPAAISPTDGSEGRLIPSHIAVGPGGVVYAAYHSQTGFDCNPDGVSGQIIVRRSTNGGVTWPVELRSVAYQPGGADITWNWQNCPEGNIPQTRFLSAGSSQPWIVPDPLTEGRVYIIAADDPDNLHGDPDDSRIYIVRSDNHGADWTAPMRIEPDTPENENTFQVFPAAAIDPVTGDLVVLWYDNRSAGTFPDPLDPEGPELFYLNVWFSISTDQGASFSVPQRMSDQPMDHVLGANGVPGHLGTRRMGEYIGVGLVTDVASNTQHLYAAWTGNDDTGQQIFFGTDQCDDCPWDLNDDGIVKAFDLAVLLGNWGTSLCVPPDFDGDGDVDAADLAQLLGRWGPCP